MGKKTICRQTQANLHQLEVTLHRATHFSTWDFTMILLQEMYDFGFRWTLNGEQFSLNAFKGPITLHVMDTTPVYNTTSFVIEECAEAIVWYKKKFQTTK